MSARSPSPHRETSIERAVSYGNMALEYERCQREVQSLQQLHITKLANLIGCEVGYVLFLVENTRELVFTVRQRWFRVPMSACIEGQCAAYGGEVMLVTDAKTDSRYNRAIDEATGIFTRNMLCQPLRMNRGGGRVVGVVKMMNKNAPEGFDEGDKELLAVCVQRVADDLHLRFRELLSLVDRFSSTAKLIVASVGGGALREREATVGSVSGRTNSAQAMRRTFSDTAVSVQELIQKVSNVALTSAERDEAGRADRRTSLAVSGAAGEAVKAGQVMRERRLSYGRELRSALGERGEKDVVLAVGGRAGVRFPC